MLLFCYFLYNVAEYLCERKYVSVEPIDDFHVDKVSSVYKDSKNNLQYYIVNILLLQ